MNQTLSVAKASPSGDGRLIFGLSIMQGRRVSLRDGHALLNLRADGGKEQNAQSPIDQLSTFGIYNRHGGDQVAVFAKQRTFEEGDLDQALKDVILTVLNDSKHEASGCTASVNILSTEKIYIGNVGNLRSVLCVNGRANTLSAIHVNDDDEFVVIDSRKPAELSLEHQMVTAHPDIIVHDITAEDEFLVIASSVIYDHVSSEVVVEFVRCGIAEKQKLDDICENLIDSCLGSEINRDNMTMAIIGLQHGMTKERWYDEIARRVKSERMAQLVGLAEYTSNEAEIGKLPGLPPAYRLMEQDGTYPFYFKRTHKRLLSNAQLCESREALQTLADAEKNLRAFQNGATDPKLFQIIVAGLDECLRLIFLQPGDQIRLCLASSLFIEVSEKLTFHNDYCVCHEHQKFRTCRLASELFNRHNGDTFGERLRFGLILYDLLGNTSLEPRALISWFELIMKQVPVKGDQPLWWEKSYSCVHTSRKDSFFQSHLRRLWKKLGIDSFVLWLQNYKMNEDLFLRSLRSLVYAYERARVHDNFWIWMTWRDMRQFRLPDIVPMWPSYDITGTEDPLSKNGVIVEVAKQVKVILPESSQEWKRGTVLYDFRAHEDDELSIDAGDEVIILDDTKSIEWWQVRRIKNSKDGAVPSSCITVTGTCEAPQLPKRLIMIENAKVKGESLVGAFGVKLISFLKRFCRM